MAEAAVEAGADILSLINTLTGMEIDIRARRPVLANLTGGLSGPAIRPVALRMVWEVYRAVKTPLIGMGGIASAREAIAFMLAGASAIAIGTAGLVDPGVYQAVAEGIRTYLVEEKFSSVGEIVGLAHRDAV